MPTLMIDDIKVEVAEGTTVLNAARKAGVKIPTLCYLEDVQAIGACRVCIVEVEGARTLVASCVMPAAEGMKVVLADLDDEALQACVDVLVDEGAQALGVVTDVSRYRTWRCCGTRRWTGSGPCRCW